MTLRCGWHVQVEIPMAGYISSCRSLEDGERKPQMFGGMTLRQPPELLSSSDGMSRP